MAERARVLIVDDEPGPRESLKIVLKAEFDVRAVARGSEALELLAREPFDIVLLDLRMPEDLSGTETLEQIRARSIDVEAIVITGQGALDTAVSCLRLGALDYIAKPFEPGYVLNRVRSAAAARAARHRAERIRDQILGHISHEFRTPFNQIFGYLEMLNDEFAPELRDEVQRCLSGIHTSSERLFGFLEGLCFLTELDAGTFRAERREFAVRPWLDRLLVPVRRIAARRGLELEVACDEHLAGFSHPETLAHLVGVALQKAATEAASQLRVRVEGGPAPGLRITIEHDAESTAAASPGLPGTEPLALEVASRAAAVLSAAVETRTRLAERPIATLTIELPGEPAAEAPRPARAPARAAALEQRPALGAAP